MKDKTSLIIMVCVLVIPAAYIVYSTLADFSLGRVLQGIDLP